MLIPRNAMVLPGMERGRRASLVLHPCVGQHCKVDMTKTIPEFGSTQRAGDAGWRYAASLKLSPTGKLGWLCPDCVAALGLK